MRVIVVGVRQTGRCCQPAPIQPVIASLLVLYNRKSICLVALGVGSTAATTDSCECTANCCTYYGTNTALDDFEAGALIERGKHAYRRSK